MDKDTLVDFFKTFIDKKLRIDGADTIVYINNEIININQCINFINSNRNIDTYLNTEEKNILIDTLDIITRTILNNASLKKLYKQTMSVLKNIYKNVGFIKPRPNHWHDNIEKALNLYETSQPPMNRKIIVNILKDIWKRLMNGNQFGGPIDQDTGKMKVLKDKRHIKEMKLGLYNAYDSIIDRILKGFDELMKMGIGSDRILTELDNEIDNENGNIENVKKKILEEQQKIIDQSNQSLQQREPSTQEPSIQRPSTKGPSPPSGSSNGIERFINAQNNGDGHGSNYSTALEEMRFKSPTDTGKKQTHWIWYCFPKFLGDGSSDLAIKYAINSPEEAVDYFRDRILKDRYIDLSVAVKVALDNNRGSNKRDKLLYVMSESIDVAKLHESVSLFYLVAKHLRDETSASTLEGILNYYGGVEKIHDLTLATFSSVYGNPLDRAQSTADVNPFTVDRYNSDVGIQNVGNQCYFISILQAFLSIPEVKSALIQAPNDITKPMFMALKKICEYKDGEPGVITYRVQDLVTRGVDSIEEVLKTPPEIIKSLVI